MNKKSKKRKLLSALYSIRKYVGVAGGRHKYFHCQIEAVHWKTALKLARLEENKQEWYWVDSFDVCTEDYKKFEFLGRFE